MTQLIIRNSDEWLDLREGEEATIKGRLDYAGIDGLTISFPDWEHLAIDADDARALRPAEGEDIEIVVTRTEDGLFATTDAITDALVQLGTV